MPEQGEAGCVCLRYEGENSWVELRGPPYSKWGLSGSSGFELLHGKLSGWQASVLHAGDVLAILPKYPEYTVIKQILDRD